MLNSRIISDRQEIDSLLPRCLDLAKKSRCIFPYQYMYLPLYWWDHFNSLDGVPFGKKRGRNFLGVQGWLESLYFVIAEDGQDLCGAVPLVSWSVRIPDSAKKMRILLNLEG